MRWCLITYPDLPAAPPAPVAEDAFDGYYAPRGWVRVSGWTTDPHTPADAWPPHEDAPPKAEDDEQEKPAPKKAAAKDKES